MTEPVKGFQTSEGTKQYDYNALANKPVLITQDQIDAALKAAKEYTDDEIKKIEIPESEPIDLSKYATTEWVEKQNYLSSIPNEYITLDELTNEVNSALAQAKANGDFKGEPGDDYILTDIDKNEIADIVLGQIEIPEPPDNESVDLTGYATEAWVKEQNYLTSIPDNYVTSDELTNEVSSALTQAKQNGDFKGDPGDDYILTETDKQEIASMIQIPDLPDTPSSENKVLIIDASGDEIAYGSNEIIELTKQGYNISLYDGSLIYILNCIIESDNLVVFSSTSYFDNYLQYASIEVHSSGWVYKSQSKLTELFDLRPYGNNVNHILKASSSGVDWVNFTDEVVNIVTEKFTNVAEVGA